MKQYDVVAVGESLMDFVSVKGGSKGSILMEGNAGGAPANVLAMLCKLGRTASFIGKVGQDAFGDYLKKCIAESGVDTGAMVSGEEPTTLAMVTLDETGNRSFAFYRNQTADVMLYPHEIDMELVKSARIFHFGSVSLAGEPAANATMQAAKAARQAGAIISFDPNYRSFLWKRSDDAVKAILPCLELADYVKLSDEEALLLTGEQHFEKAAQRLEKQYKFRFLAVTLGAKGCIGITPTAQIQLPAFAVKTVDTTGAGDAFWGAALHQLLSVQTKDIDSETLKNIVEFANAAGSLATTGYGAIPSQPSEDEIRTCINKVSRLN